ncbi:MAG: hypothetical protein DRH44_04505 [Candidatus Coatesbacteria bacterium]|nr:MAG: hypothetical protein DRH49_02705 [Candidatus Coatesbacteria bacterium]RLC43659.1 MAG: hypothetical protein DRH44_04505 [Candidatus Coatesbacteria bacterium]
MSKEIGDVALKRFCRDFIRQIDEYAWDFYLSHYDDISYRPFYAIWRFHLAASIKSAHLYRATPTYATPITSDYARFRERITLHIPHEAFEAPGPKVLIIIDPRIWRMSTISLMYALERVPLGLDGIAIISPQSYPVRDDTIIAQYYEYRPKRSVKIDDTTVRCEEFMAELMELNDELCDIADQIKSLRAHIRMAGEEGNIEFAMRLDELMRRLATLTSSYIDKLRIASRACMKIVLRYRTSELCRPETITSTII